MELKDLNEEAVAASVTGVAIGFPALLVFLKKLFLNSKMTDTQITAAEAHTGVIDMLRGEITRLDKNNQAMNDRISEVHKENITLRNENINLREEISGLNMIIGQMRDEIDGIGRRGERRSRGNS